MPPAFSRFKVFISYRRDDQGDFVHLLRKFFTLHYGKDNIFMDSYGISAGAQWKAVIVHKIRWCDAVVAIIGPEWVKRLRDLAIEEFDPVRTEIALALAEKKVIIPVCIKGAAIPQADSLHFQVRDMLKYNAVILRDVLDSDEEIDRLTASIDRTLSEREDLEKAAQKLDELPPAAGLALGYFVNFVRPVIQKIIARTEERDRFSYGIAVTDRNDPPQIVWSFGDELPDRLDLKLHIVIPHRAALLKPRILDPIKKGLSQAQIRASPAARPFTVDAWQTTGGGFQFIDFPNTLTVLEDWVERRLPPESRDANSPEWRRIETEEIERFETMLRWWIDGAENGADFRDRVRLIRFPGAPEEFAWLESAWKASGGRRD